VLPMTQYPKTKETRGALARRLSLDFMDPLFKRDVAEKIDRLNEHGTFPGIAHYASVATATIAFADAIRDWEVVLIEPDQIATNVAKFEQLLRAEYESAAAKGRAAYPPEQITTPGPDVFTFLDSARLSMSEVHIGDLAGAPAMHAPQADRYQNRLSKFGADVKKARDRRQIVFTATKGGAEKVERLMKEFEFTLEITPGALPRGFHFDEINLTAYSEWDLFEPPTSTRIGGRKRTA